MSKEMYTQSRGVISGGVVASIVLGLLCLVFGSVMIWALVNYNDQKNNVDSKILTEVQAAQKQQKVDDQKEFDEKQKDPLKEFIGPNDLGRVSFKYPKNWSVYIADDGGQSGGYEAYLHPDQVVNPTDINNKIALRVQILEQSYDQVLEQYSGLIKSGQLRSSTVVANGFNGNKVEGNFTQQLEGSAVIFKIRDKTLVLKTDSPTFRPDFDEKVVKSLTFSQ